jgi:hypothetical protein
MIVSLVTIHQFASKIFFKISNSFQVNQILTQSISTIFLSEFITIHSNEIELSFQLSFTLLIIVFNLAKSSLGENGFAI